MHIQCPQCRNLIPLNGQILTGEEGICCAECRLEINIRLSATLPADDRQAPAAGLRLNVSPESLAELRAAPSRATPPRPSRGTLPWTLANLALILLLVGQYAYFMRADLARHVALRPWLEALCRPLHCRIPPLRDPEHLKVVAYSLQPHPDARDALLATVTVVNETGVPLAYPTLVLSFRDLEQHLLARRAFPPEVYLPPDADPQQGLPPDTPYPITLELVDPGRAAVNFQFELR